MLDSLLDWSVVGLPTILAVLGVFVSIKIPHAKHHRYWYIGLVATGVFVSSITFWQQYRTRQAHEAEVVGLNNNLKQVQSQVAGLQQQTALLTQSQQTETIRRQQAERDLQNLVGAVGDRTRQGVMADIKSSPIRVEVNGRPTRDPAEIKRVREALGDFMRAGAQLRNRCRTDPPDSPLQRDVDAWYSNAQAYLQKNLDTSFHSQFITDRSTALVPNGVPEARVNLWSAIDQRIETLGKFIDQLK